MRANLRKHYESLLDIIAVYRARINDGTASQDDRDDLKFTIERAKVVEAKLNSL